MSLTPEQVAMIRKKEADLPDALKRDQLTNYFEGWFFITLNTRGEAPILSSVRGHVGGVGEDAPHCEYTELGMKVMEAWRRNQEVYPEVEVIAAEAMPEHFHGLLRLKKGNRRHLGRIVWGFMAGCSHGYWDTLGIDWRSMTYEKGARAPEWQDRYHTRSLRGPALFVRGYNDVEPLTEEAVQVKIEYIRHQAEKRLIQGDRHECFTVIRNARSRNWTADIALGAVVADQFFARNAEARERAVCSIKARLASSPGGLGGSAILDYLGDKRLMASERKLPLVCHRADAARFEEQKNAVLDAARRGCIIVSAFISEKERDIKRQLMVEQLPFIEIMDNGFSLRYKPTGKAFYACAENRLVQVSCWRYEYQKDVKVSREMCLVMNHLARVISGRADDWWRNWGIVGFMS